MYFITTKRMLEVCFFQHTPTFIIEPEFQRNSSGPASFFASVTQASIPFLSLSKLPLQSRKRPGKQEKGLIYKA